MSWEQGLATLSPLSPHSYTAYDGPSILLTDLTVISSNPLGVIFILLITVLDFNQGSPVLGNIVYVRYNTSNFPVCSLRRMKKLPDGELYGVN